MSTEPNADEFTIHRWYRGNSTEPVYVVSWEQTYSDGEDDDEDEEQERDFATLDDAFLWGRQLLEASDSISRTW